MNFERMAMDELLCSDIDRNLKSVLADVKMLNGQGLSFLLKWRAWVEKIEVELDDRIERKQQARLD